MKKAVIDTATGLVENIIVADDSFDPGPGKELRDPTGARIGGTWDGAQYLPPPPPPPPPPDPDVELEAAIVAARASYVSATDQPGRDAAFLELCDALLGVSAAGKVAGRPV